MIGKRLFTDITTNRLFSTFSNHLIICHTLDMVLL